MQSSSPRVGIVLVAHGTVHHVDELPEFVRIIRRGRPPPEGLLEELRERYERIGGSPLLEITNNQAQALSAKLGLPTFVAMRLWHPFLEEVLPRLQDLEQICVLPMAPYSVHVYREAAERVFRSSRLAPKPLFVEPWGMQPELIKAHARMIQGSVEKLADTAILLTAHSLPLSAIQGGDPYAQQFEASARAVERALGQKCYVAYQSQGAGGGEWLGPTVEETLLSLAEANIRRVAVAPIGFLADHVETLYDLDVAALEQARCLGLDFVRVPALNADEGLIGALASVVYRTLAPGGGSPAA